MGDLAIGLGILLAILGPVLLIPITWLLYRFAARPVLTAFLRSRVSTNGIRLASLATAVVVVVATLAASHFPGRQEFDQICDEHATPSITERVTVDGFFRTKMFPYEAGEILESFSFVEAPDPYRKGINLRYVREGDSIEHVEATTLQSQYGVRKAFSELAFGITMTEKHIFELSGNREIARAALIRYEGGSLFLLLGSYGRSSCPDIRSEDGSRDFGTFYDLETIVLGASHSEE